MKIKILLVLFIVLGISIFADEYILIGGKYEYREISDEIRDIYNKELRDYKRVRNEELKEIKNIELAMGEEISIKVDDFIYEVKKEELFINGYITDNLSLRILKDSKEIKKVEYGREEDGFYDFKLPLFEKESYDNLKNIIGKEFDFFSYIGGREHQFQLPMKINLLKYKDKKFIDINAKYGKNEYKILFDIVKLDDMPAIIYMKMTDINMEKSFEKTYKKAMDYYHKDRDIKKTVEILENGGFERIVRRNPKGVSKARYLTMLNDYAYFLSEIGREAEAIAILRDIIYLSPERVVAYLNLGDIYEKFYKKTKDKEAEKLAKETYMRYAKLIKSEKKKVKLPKRVKKRIMWYKEDLSINFENKYKLDYINYEKYTLENALKLMQKNEYRIRDNYITKLSEEEIWKVFNEFKKGNFEEIKPVYESYYLDDLKILDGIFGDKSHDITNSYFEIDGGGTPILRSDFKYYLRLYKGEFNNNFKDGFEYMVFRGIYINDKNNFYNSDSIYAGYKINEEKITGTGSCLVEAEINYFTGRPIAEYSSGSKYGVMTGLMLMDNKPYIYEVKIAELIGREDVTNSVAIHFWSEKKRDFYKVHFSRGRKK